MDTFGSLLHSHFPYQALYTLCEEMIAVSGAVIMGLLGGILYMRRQDAKRQETAIQLLMRLIEKIEDRP